MIYEYRDDLINLEIDIGEVEHPPAHTIEEEVQS